MSVSSPHLDPAALIRRWLDAGIITAEQAETMTADLGAPAQTPPQRSLLAEALGYFGGALLVVAVGLVLGRVWPDLPTAARLALAGGAAAALVAAGVGVPVRWGPVGVRLRSALWLAAVAVTGGFLGLLGSTALGLAEEYVTLLVGVGTTAMAGTLWWRHHYLAQHLAVIVATATLALAVADLLPHEGDAPAAAVWMVGVVWVVLARGGVVRPRREGLAVGAVGTCLVGAHLAALDWGAPLALGAVIALAALAVRLRDVLLLVIAAAGTLVVLPQVVGRYFPGALSAAVVLFVIGGLLVAVAVLAVRRGPAPGDTADSTAPTPSGTGIDTAVDTGPGTSAPGGLRPPHVALALAVVLVTGTTVAIMTGVLG
jgi:uncharacterized membrane protein